MRTSGLPVAPDAAQSLLRQRPPGTAVQAKFVFGLYLGPGLIGCADVIRGRPDAATAHTGLLLVTEPWQRQGHGRRAYALLESAIRTWRECQRVRIGVVQRNSPGFAFLASLGLCANR